MKCTEQLIINRAIDELCDLYADQTDGQQFIGGTIPIEYCFPAVNNYDSRQRLLERIDELISHIGSHMDQWMLSTHTFRRQECLCMIRTEESDEDDVEIILNLKE